VRYLERFVRFFRRIPDAPMAVVVVRHASEPEGRFCGRLIATHDFLLGFSPDYALRVGGSGLNI